MRISSETANPNGAQIVNIATVYKVAFVSAQLRLFTIKQFVKVMYIN